MKNIKFLILSLFAFSLVLSCRSEEKYYEGEEGLMFSTATDASVLVNQGESKVVQINFGTLTNVNTDHTVSLVLDQEMSDTFQAGAIEILNEGKSVVSNGTSGNFFEVKLTGDLLTSDPKKAVFKLESSTLGNATFNQTFALSASQVCPISSFLGSFNNDAGWWHTYSNGFVSQDFVVEAGTEANTILIKDFFEAGKDFTLVYDPETFAVTTPNIDDASNPGIYTGYDYQNNPSQKVYAKVKVNSGSTINPCTRVIDLVVTYHVPGLGSFGDQEEHFVGN